MAVDFHGCRASSATAVRPSGHAKASIFLMGLGADGDPLWTDGDVSVLLVVP